MTQPQTEFLDLYRAGLKTAADLMKASLQSAERLQNQQLVAIRTALDQQAKTISELGQARSIDELACPADQDGRRAVGADDGLLDGALPDPDRAGPRLDERAAQVATAGSNASMRQVGSGNGSGRRRDEPN